MYVELIHRSLVEDWEICEAAEEEQSISSNGHGTRPASQTTTAEAAKSKLEDIDLDQLRHLLWNNKLHLSAPTALSIPTSLSSPLQLPSASATALPPLWLAVDQVHDVQNLGNIIRSASFFGVDGSKFSLPFLWIDHMMCLCALLATFSEDFIHRVLRFLACSHDF